MMMPNAAVSFSTWMLPATLLRQNHTGSASGAGPVSFTQTLPPTVLPSSQTYRGFVASMFP